MLTRSQINHIKQLSDKKYRDEVGEFVIEGEKLVREALLSRFNVKQILVHEHSKLELDSLDSSKIHFLKQSELNSISNWQTPQPIMAVLEKNTNTVPEPNGFHFVLDKIQDPGNVGTIIRIADWFGIESMYCSPDTADVFNSKVIQASMGSIFRVQCIVTDVLSLLSQYPTIPKYAAVLHGISLAQVNPNSKGFLLLGNESKGLRDELIELADHRITIPAKGKAESLNVAVATGIICYHLLS